MNCFEMRVADLHRSGVFSSFRRCMKWDIVKVECVNRKRMGIVESLKLSDYYVMQ